MGYETKSKREGGEQKLDGGGKREEAKNAIKVESRVRNSSLKTGRK